MKIRGLKIYLIYGKKGSGKSMYMAILTRKLFKSYYKQEKKYPDLRKRTLYSNVKFSDEVENKELGKHLQYWRDPEQLYEVRDADILWDEIGKDLPAGSWGTTPKDLKQVFSHLRKRGNRLFANTQVYEDIDISFRRQVDHAFEISKWFGSPDVSASLPPPQTVYGLLSMRAFDPSQLEYERNPEKRDELVKSWIPEFHWISKKLVDMYDTHAELPPYMPNKMRERVMICREGENCLKKDREGRPHMVVTHEPV